jgi:hypothetical protein
MILVESGDRNKEGTLKDFDKDWAKPRDLES